MVSFLNHLNAYFLYVLNRPEISELVQRLHEAKLNTELMLKDIHLCHEWMCLMAEYL